MPRKGYKVVTIKESVHKIAQKYVEEGKAKSISDLVEEAILKRVREDQVC